MRDTDERDRRRNSQEKRWNDSAIESPLHLSRGSQETWKRRSLGAELRQRMNAKPERQGTTAAKQQGRRGAAKERDSPRDENAGRGLNLSFHILIFILLASSAFHSGVLKRNDDDARAGGERGDRAAAPAATLAWHTSERGNGCKGRRGEGEAESQEAERGRSSGRPLTSL